MNALNDTRSAQTKHRSALLHEFLAHLQGSIITMEAVELAERTLDFILDNPGAHDQLNWLVPGYDADERVTVDFIDPGEVDTAINCGVKACFAGWLAVQDGKTIYVADGFGDGLREYVDGKLIELWACDRLGLPRMELDAAHPFGGSTTMTELIAWVRAMRARAEQLQASVGGPGVLAVVSS